MLEDTFQDIVSLSVLAIDRCIAATQTPHYDPVSAGQIPMFKGVSRAPVHSDSPWWTPAFWQEQQRVKWKAFPACVLCSLTCSVLFRSDPSIEKSLLVQKHKQAAPLKPV